MSEVDVLEHRSGTSSVEDGAPWITPEGHRIEPIGSNLIKVTMNMGDRDDHR